MVVVVVASCRHKEEKVWEMEEEEEKALENMEVETCDRKEAMSNWETEKVPEETCTPKENPMVIYTPRSFSLVPAPHH
jgi:hypothetical protein